MSTIGARLKEERERLGMTIPQFAEAAGAKKNTVIDWQKDLSSPPASRLADLSKIGVDVRYVLTGDRPSATQKVVSDLNQAMAEIDLLTQSDFEVVEIAEKFAMLDEDGKKAIKLMIDTLLTKK